MGRVWPVAFVALAVLLGGCSRLLPGQGPSGPPESSGEPGVGIEAEAPAACGFPEGTVLSYAGRSTTAELEVQEVVGDPLSDEPADIYITRDSFDQGDLHGRLVCAIFVNDPGFVEVTVHPDDGGRVEPAVPTPPATAPPDGVARRAAIDAARDHVEDAEQWDLGFVEAGPIGELVPHVLDDPYYGWAVNLSGDRWVWKVFFFRGDRGIDVIVDYLDGSVLGTAEYIIN